MSLTGAPPEAARPPSAEPPGPPDLSALVALGAKPEATALRYDFEAPDPVRFPCVQLAYDALEEGGNLPAILSAANEVAVAAFVEGRIGFGEIPRIIEGAMERVDRGEPTLDGVRTADRKARTTAAQIVESIERPLPVKP